MNIYTTSRHLRSYLKSNLNNSSLITKAITIDEFENRSIVIENLKFIDFDLRTIFMHQATDFKNFARLNFNKEFINFFFESDLIFKFFEEIFFEDISLDDLIEKKIYTDFSEEIEILKTLLENYLKILNENGYYDRISIPKDYKLNLEYLKNIDCVDLYLESYMSKFEFKLFDEISQILEFRIHLNSNKFNKKMLEKFNSYGFELSSGYFYTLNLSSKQIIKQEKIKTSTEFDIASFSQRLNQIGFIKSKIYEYIEIDKFSPENIAIITPDESFSQFLDLFDSETNINLAMGKSSTNSRLFQYLDALVEFMKEQNIITKNRLNRLSIDKELEDTFISQKDSLNFDFYTHLSKILSRFADDKLYDFANRELYRLRQYDFYLSKIKLKQKLQIYLTNLSNKKLDDTEGGKITVLGLLETRGISFDGVVIVDFNEDIVPKYNQKDIFLSTLLRMDLGLPTKYDRLNLQKYLYKRVFENSKKVAISYVQNDTSIPSRFLTELNLKKSLKPLDEYYDYLTINFVKRDIFDKDIEIEYNFLEQSISATSLKTFLTCKRRYFYQYIQQINQHEISILPAADNIGSIIHDTLKKLFLDIQSLHSCDEMKKLAKKYLFEHISENSITNYELSLWSKKIEKFCEIEFERINNKIKPIEIEQKINFKYLGFQIFGAIDRIDKAFDEYHVIDYKTSNSLKVDSKKSVENSKDFQLQIYYLYALREKKYSPVKAYYYDLNKFELLEEVEMGEKLDRLNSILDDLKRQKSINFSKCENLKDCNFCPYKIACGR